MSHLVYCWFYHQQESSLCRLCIRLQKARIIAFVALVINTTISIFELKGSTFASADVLAVAIRMLILWTTVGVLTTAIASAISWLNEEHKCGKGCHQV